MSAIAMLVRAARALAPWLTLLLSLFLSEKKLRPVELASSSSKHKGVIVCVILKQKVLPVKYSTILLVQWLGEGHWKSEN